MFDSKNLLYILTILESIEKIYLYSKNYNSSVSLWEANNQMNYNACITLLLAISEDVNKIDKKLKNKYKNIPWKKLKGLRNRIAHDYRGLNHEITFDIIKNYLDELKVVAIDMLNFVDYENRVLEIALNSEYYQNLNYLKEKLKKR